MKEEEFDREKQEELSLPGSPEPPKGQPYKIGDRIGEGYQIYRILGGEEGHGGVKSGMGIIYVCYNHESGRVLALKTFQDKFLSSKGMKDNFKKEALAWIHLEEHPYIVRAYVVEELDYRMFVGCEFIAPDEEGRNTLTHYLKGAISLKQALTWSIQFCHGMEHACSHGVTPHRDIKPDNIMITRDGIVKIADFGLAGLWAEAEMAGALRGLMEEDRHGLTFIRLAGGKVVAGTLQWMAPEQFEGEADVRSDIYSFGIVLYQIANGGGLPFSPGRRDDWKIAHQTYPVPALSSRLFPLTERCLQKKPEDRYRGFHELREELERLYGEVTGKRPPSPPSGIVLGAWERLNKGVSLGNLGLLDEAIGEYREALRINPEFAEAHNNLGATLQDKGFLDEAIGEYLEAIRINPDYAEPHNNLGIALKAKGLLDEAIGEYREALRINPDHAEAHNNQGATLQDKGFLDEAIGEYQEAIRSNPKHVEAHINLGAALYAKGLLDEAIGEYREAIRINPDYAAAHVDLGVALKDKGLLDEAIEEYREVLRINPGHIEAHVNLGNALEVKGLLEEAIGEYREALWINPEFAEVHYNLGLTLKEKGLLDEAIEEYREVLRINPGYAAAHVDLGVALKAKGFLGAAVEEYREALRINPRHAEAHYNLGIALHDKGLLDEAIKAFENFIKYAPPQYARHVEEMKEVIRQMKGQR